MVTDWNFILAFLYNTLVTSSKLIIDVFCCDKFIFAHSQKITNKTSTMVCESPPTFNNSDICNNLVIMASDYTDRFSINYPIQSHLGYVLLDSNPLDEVN